MSELIVVDRGVFKREKQLLQARLFARSQFSKHLLDKYSGKSPTHSAGISFGIKNVSNGLRSLTRY